MTRDAYADAHDKVLLKTSFMQFDEMETFLHKKLSR